MLCGLLNASRRFEERERSIGMCSSAIVAQRWLSRGRLSFTNGFRASRPLDTPAGLSDRISTGAAMPGNLD